MRIFIFVFLVLFLSCSAKEEFMPVYDVPSEFQFIVKTFIQEAANRGLVINIDNLIIKYDPTLAVDICGRCNSNALDAKTQKIITINPTFICWSNDVEKETLIFHELGHCILGRLHKNDELPNGDPKSLMTQSNVSVYSPCSYPIGGECENNTFKRSYYLDELFNENTPIPSWAK